MSHPHSPGSLEAIYLAKHASAVNARPPTSRTAKLQVAATSPGVPPPFSPQTASALLAAANHRTPFAAASTHPTSRTSARPSSAHPLGRPFGHASGPHGVVGPVVRNEQPSLFAPLLQDMEQMFHDAMSPINAIDANGRDGRYTSTQPLYSSAPRPLPSSSSSSLLFAQSQADPALPPPSIPGPIGVSGGRQSTRPGSAVVRGRSSDRRVASSSAAPDPSVYMSRKGKTALQKLQATGRPDHTMGFAAYQATLQAAKKAKEKERDEKQEAPAATPFTSPSFVLSYSVPQLQRELASALETISLHEAATKQQAEFHATRIAALEAEVRQWKRMCEVYRNGFANQMQAVAAATQATPATAPKPTGTPAAAPKAAAPTSARVQPSDEEYEDDSVDAAAAPPAAASKPQVTAAAAAAPKTAPSPSTSRALLDEYENEFDDDDEEEKSNVQVQQRQVPPVSTTATKLAATTKPPLDDDAADFEIHSSDLPADTPRDTAPADDYDEDEISFEEQSVEPIPSKPAPATGSLRKTQKAEPSRKATNVTFAGPRDEDDGASGADAIPSTASAPQPSSARSARIAQLASENARRAAEIDSMFPSDEDDQETIERFHEQKQHRQSSEPARRSAGPAASAPPEDEEVEIDMDDDDDDAFVPPPARAPVSSESRDRFPSNAPHLASSGVIRPSSAVRAGRDGGSRPSSASSRDSSRPSSASRARPTLTPMPIPSSSSSSSSSSTHPSSGSARPPPVSHSSTPLAPIADRDTATRAAVTTHAAPTARDDEQPFIFVRDEDDDGDDGSDLYEEDEDSFHVQKA